MKSNWFLPFPFLGRNHITVPLQNGSRWYGWLTAEDNSCTNASITFLNTDNSILHIEVNECGTIYISAIRIAFGNDYIYVLHDLSKGYIYVYLISNLIGSEAIFQIMIWQTIYWLLSRGTEREGKKWDWLIGITK